jgi:hypothetical protein
VADEKTFEKAQTMITRRDEDASLHRRPAHRFHMGSDVGWPARRASFTGCSA